jgi:hypothetical protein
VSRLLSKIMLALLMLPMAGVVYILTIMILIDTVYGYSSDVAPFIFTSLIVWTFIAAYWTLLWGRTVRWTRHRIVLTIGATVVVLAPATAGGLLVSTVDNSFGAFVGGVVAILLWLTCTVFVWRETGSERRARFRTGSVQAIVCPACGYNLTGLAQTTCPECGATYTIDELVAAQPARERAEIEA